MLAKTVLIQFSRLCGKNFNLLNNCAALLRTAISLISIGDSISDFNHKLALMAREMKCFILNDSICTPLKRYLPHNSCESFENGVAYSLNILMGFDEKVRFSFIFR